MDPKLRIGPEAMAVDTWLLERIDVPLLRVYRWLGEWGSLGYFGKIADAEAVIPQIEWVRRWTGGGFVDHRTDWTYSLVIPRSERLANLRGADSYRIMHHSLAEALQAEGIAATVCGSELENGRSLCFENPVSYDLVGADGSKLAGAGQRRSKYGLLHQGSVSIGCANDGESRLRAANFAKNLSDAWRWVKSEEINMDAFPAVQQRLHYENISWRNRR